eukprot:7547079-Alexandrium_andersonii.AAC.1
MGRLGPFQWCKMLRESFEVHAFALVSSGCARLQWRIQAQMPTNQCNPEQCRSYVVSPGCA